MQVQRRAVLAQDAGEGNPNHSKENGQFTSGSSVTSKATGKVGTVTHSDGPSAYVKWKSGGPEQAVHHMNLKGNGENTAAIKGASSSNYEPLVPETRSKEEAYKLPKDVYGEKTNLKMEHERDAEQKYKTELATEQGRKNHRSIASAFNSGQSKKIGNYSTDGKAIYLHGNKIVEKGENGEINFTLAGWPTNTTRSSLRDFGINVSTKQGKQNYTHSGGTEEIDSNKMYRAKDEQPQLALDPNSAAVNSPTPWKGRTLDNDPVGDRSSSPDVANTGGAGGSNCNTWNGRTLD